MSMIDSVKGSFHKETVRRQVWKEWKALNPELPTFYTELDEATRKTFDDEVQTRL